MTSPDNAAPNTAPPSDDTSKVRDVSDEELLRLSAEPPRDLFPQLAAAVRMSPLIVAWALLPGCYALFRRTFDERDALWALRALAISAVENGQAFLEAGEPGGDVPLAGRPPLASWLGAMCFRLAGATTLAGPIGVSYIAAVTAAFAVVGTAWRLAGARSAAFTAMVLVFNAQWLRTLQTVAPDALTLAAVSVCIWACVSSFQKQRRSWWCVVLGSVSLGVGILAGGVASFEAVLLTLSLAYLIHVDTETEDSPGFPTGQRDPARRPLTLGLVLIGGGLLGFWWPVMMAWRYSGEFWMHWLDPHVPLQIPLSRDLAVREYAGLRTILLLVVRDWIGWAGVLLVGAIAVPALAPGRNGKKTYNGLNTSVWLPTIWLAVTAILVTYFAAFGVEGHLFSERWSCMLLIPGTIIVGTTLNRITTREIGVRWVAVIMLSSIVAALIAAFVPRLLTSSQQSLFELLLPLQIVLAMALLWCARTKREIGMRWTLRGWLILVVGTASINGMLAVNAKSKDDSRLRHMQSRLALVEDIDTVVFVTRRSQLAPQLQWIARSRWPNAAEKIVDAQNPAGLTDVLDDPASERRRMLIVYWSRREYRPVVEPRFRLRVVRLVEPVRYHRRQLGAYLLTSDAF